MYVLLSFEVQGLGFHGLLRNRREPFYTLAAHPLNPPLITHLDLSRGQNNH